ncbi:MAG: sugar phosphate nucleotidyltransferase [Candidatus Hodarchaeales archaeon]
MKALILAGGSGKEMLPLSAYCPKTLLSLHGKAILEYVIEGLIETGFKEFVIVVGHYGEKIEQMVKKYRKRDILIELVDQGDLRGIEGAIQAASGKFQFEGSFLLAYGDIIASSDFYRHLVNSQVNTAADGAIAVTLVGKSSEFGIASIDDHGFISKILPEVQEHEEEANYIFAGACILPNEFFEILHEEKRLTSALARMLKEQRRLCASVWQDEWIDIGYGWDLLEANRDIFGNIEYSRIHKTASISPSAHMSGLVFIEKNVVIDHNAEIVGPCFIGENTYIGTNSLIRDHACIEKNCKIGYSVEIKNSVIQPSTKIGRLSFIGDSVVGEEARIGAGVTTMNDLSTYSYNKTAPRTIKGREFHKLGAIIGPKSEVGSNTVILPTVTISNNQVISPGSVLKNDD